MKKTVMVMLSVLLLTGIVFGQSPEYGEVVENWLRTGPTLSNVDLGLTDDDSKAQKTDVAAADRQGLWWSGFAVSTNPSAVNANNRLDIAGNTQHQFLRFAQERDGSGKGIHQSGSHVYTRFDNSTASDSKSTPSIILNASGSNARLEIVFVENLGSNGSKFAALVRDDSGWWESEAKEVAYFSAGSSATLTFNFAGSQAVSWTAIDMTTTASIDMDQVDAGGEYGAYTLLAPGGSPKLSHIEGMGIVCRADSAPDDRIQIGKLALYAPQDLPSPQYGEVVEPFLRPGPTVTNIDTGHAGPNDEKVLKMSSGYWWGGCAVGSNLHPTGTYNRIDLAGNTQNQFVRVVALNGMGVHDSGSRIYTRFDTTTASDSKSTPSIALNATGSNARMEVVVHENKGSDGTRLAVIIRDDTGWWESEAKDLATGIGTLTYNFAGTEAVTWTQVDMSDIAARDIDQADAGGETGDYALLSQGTPNLGIIVGMGVVCRLDGPGQDRMQIGQVALYAPEDTRVTEWSLY